MTASSPNIDSRTYRKGNPEGPLLHINTCADLLGLVPYEAMGLVETGQLGSEKIDSRTYIPLDDVIRYARIRNAAEREQMAWANALAIDILDGKIDPDGAMAAMAERLESVR